MRPSAREIAAHRRQVGAADAAARPCDVTHSGPRHCRGTGSARCGRAPACPAAISDCGDADRHAEADDLLAVRDRPERDLVAERDRLGGRARPGRVAERAASPAAISRDGDADIVALSQHDDIRRQCHRLPFRCAAKPRHAGRLHHGQRLAAIALAHVARRRPAAARRQADQLHAELVEIAVAARVVRARSASTAGRTASPRRRACGRPPDSCPPATSSISLMPHSGQ